MSQKVSGDQKIQAVEIQSLVISESSKELFNYEDKKDIVIELSKQIQTTGVYSPLVVMKKEHYYVILDGVLRFMALESLNLNLINCFVLDEAPASSEQVKDLIISFNLKSTPSIEEKKKMIVHYLRLEDESVKLDGKTFEERIQFVTAQFGKGWGRNNVFNFKKVLGWEKKNPDTNFNLSTRIVSGEVSSERGKNFVDILENPRHNYSLEKEKESKILETFLKNVINLENAESLINDYNRKKEAGHTPINLSATISADKYHILPGNCLDTEFPVNTLLDGIFTSVPYFQQVKYGKNVDKGQEFEIGREKTPQKYVENIVKVMKKGADNMKDSGVIIININDSYKDGLCVGVVPLLIVEMMKAGFGYVAETIWVKSNNKPQNDGIKRFSNGYEPILIFTKTTNYYYNQFKIYNPNKQARITKGCSEQGEKSLEKNNMTFHISNPYDQIRNLLYENDIEGIIKLNITADRSQKEGLQNGFFGSFPTLLPVPFLLSFIPEHGTVWDPFGGTGTTGRVALMLNRKVIISELYEKNVVKIEEILQRGISEFNEADYELVKSEFLGDETFSEAA
jgi:DNA modification methylase